MMSPLKLLTYLILMTSAVVVVGFRCEINQKPDIYLKSGNVIHFTKIYESGAKQSVVTEITSVTSLNGVSKIMAKCKMYDDANKFVIAYNYKFYMDSLSWCADALNWMYVSDETNKEITWTLESDSLVFPYNMKAGDTLLPARARKASSGKGMSTDETQFTYNRKVVKLDTIPSAMGPITAWRITCKVSVKNKSVYGPMGTVNDDYVMNATQWFNSTYGIVQEERVGKYGSTKLVIQTLK